MLRQTVVAIAILATLSFSSGQSYAASSGRGLTMWEEVDTQMIDLIKDGYALVSHHYHSDRLGSTDTYHLQKEEFLFRCSEITVSGDPQKGLYKTFFCLRLIHPRPLE